jgi:hypothetical protein
MQFHYVLFLLTLVSFVLNLSITIMQNLFFTLFDFITFYFGLDFMHLICLLGFRYWLYAAVKLRCLLVTNDEMRDHIFELIGSNFFNQWKERHQVRHLFLILLILASSRDFTCSRLCITTWSMHLTLSAFFRNWLL